MPRVLRLVTAAFLCVPAPVHAHTTDGSGWKAAVGLVHPFLVHFPVALIVAGLVAEILCIVRKEGRYADAARFMIVAAAWISIPAALAGFARADTITLDAPERSLFAVHRVAGIATPVLAFLCAGLAQGVRRTGQIWELMLYRVVFVLAAVSAMVAGYYGGEIVYGVFPLW